MLDDKLGFLERVLGQAGLHERISELALIVVHVSQWQTVPIDGRVVPKDTLAVHILIDGFVPLVSAEALDELLGGLCHASG